MHRITKRKIWAIIALLTLFVVATGESCSDNSQGGKATSNERLTQQNNYAKLVAAQPSHTMQYSATRETINFWIDTWKSPGKLSYVYLQAANGQLTGYYILKGLPVSMCASQTPTYTFVNAHDNWWDEPAPSIDGVFYGGQGSCNRYYGRDASNNAYVDFTAGGGAQDMQIYDRPLPRQDVEPLAFATIKNVK